MMLLLILCMFIVGGFVLAYIIITCMVHIIRAYYDLPPLPWEFAIPINPT